MKIREIVQFLDGELVNADGGIEIKGCAKLDDAGPNDISFLANIKYKSQVDLSKAAAVLVAKDMTLDTERALLKVKDPYFAFQRLLEKLYPPVEMVKQGIADSANVSESASIDEDAAIGDGVFIGTNVKIGKNTIIHPNVVVMDGVSIGSDCIIYPNVTIREKCLIGNRVILQPACVIGSDGFGFAPTSNGYRKIPQVGNVLIEDDVEIGANTAIDRATTGSTIIRQGTKIDNLVQIAHNVEIDSHTAIAGQAGISGSTKVGKWCQLGGQVGLAGHINIKDRTVIAAQSGVMSDTEGDKIYFGSPAREHRKQMQIIASLNKLPDLLKRVKKLEMNLEKQIADGEKSQ